MNGDKKGLCRKRVKGGGRKTESGNAWIASKKENKMKELKNLSWRKKTEP